MPPLKTASCWRRAKFSKSRSRRERKNPITGTGRSLNKHNMTPMLHGLKPHRMHLHLLNVKADRYFGERQPIPLLRLPLTHLANLPSEGRVNAHQRSKMRTQLESRVAARFGVLPNFFRLTTDDPKITESLWGFAQFAYLDNPLPSLPESNASCSFAVVIIAIACAVLLSHD